MVSISPVGLKSVATRNTLDLFKNQQQSQPAVAAANSPSIAPTSRDRQATIAALINQLIGIRSGDTNGTTVATSQTNASSPSEPPRIGDGKRPLTNEEKATEKANWEAHYNQMDDDVRENFAPKVLNALSQNDLYKNDPSFQAAVKNGTLSIQSGSVIGLEVQPREVIFNGDGYYAGVKEPGSAGPGNLWKVAEYNDNGRLVSKTDGSNVAVGFMGHSTFYVTWPSAK